MFDYTTQAAANPTVVPDLPDPAEYAGDGGQPVVTYPTAAHAAAARARTAIEDPWAPHNATGTPAVQAARHTVLWAQARDAWHAANTPAAAA